MTYSGSDDGNGAGNADRDARDEEGTFFAYEGGRGGDVDNDLDSTRGPQSDRDYDDSDE